MGRRVRGGREEDCGKDRVKERITLVLTRRKKKDVCDINSNEYFDPTPELDFWEL